MILAAINFFASSSSRCAVTYLFVIISTTVVVQHDVIKIINRGVEPDDRPPQLDDHRAFAMRSCREDRAEVLPVHGCDYPFRDVAAQAAS